MGAEAFIIKSHGKTAKEAFKLAVETALYDRGHSGYTGSIAEKDKFIMISNEEFESYVDAENYANNLIDEDDNRISDKWGPAGCLKYKGKSGINYLFFGWASS